MKLLDNIKWYINQVLDYLILLYVKLKITQFVWKKIIKIYFNDYWLKYQLYIDIDGLRDKEIRINRKKYGLTNYLDIWTDHIEFNSKRRKEIESKYGIKYFGVSVLSKKTSIKTLKKDIIDFLYMLSELNNYN